MINLPTVLTCLGLACAQVTKVTVDRGNLKSSLLVLGLTFLVFFLSGRASTSKPTTLLQILQRASFPGHTPKEIETSWALGDHSHVQSETKRAHQGTEAGKAHGATCKTM